MKPPPEPSGLTADRPRRLLGLGFWAVMVFSVLCMLAAVAVATFGPRLWPAKAPPAPGTPTSLGERAKSG